MNDPEERPAPERFLAQARAAEAAERSAGVGRGRLRIFFGFAAGVGKTYAMLEEAHRLQDQGRQVLVGYVEEHGRPETDLLLQGLDCLPRRRSTHRGIALSEFDVDAAISRHPEVCVVDELAHTNAPGMRHDKRYLDILELLRNGIDVLTTVNVQHVESLSDVVTRITGVAIRETIPDFLIDEADEIHLVDLPPHDLLRRLQEGRVYSADKASLAAQRFFTNDNLIALRELAMRRIADRLGHEVDSARTRRGDRRVWGTRERLLVCVGPSPSSAHVIRTAARLARSLEAQWWTVTVQGAAPLGVGDQERLDRHLRLAERLGATVQILSGAHPAQALLDFAADRDITQIAIGRSRQPPSRGRPRTLVDELVQDSGSIDIHIIRDAEEPGGPFRNQGSRWRWLTTIPGEWMTVGGVVAALGVAALLEPLGLAREVSGVLLIALVVVLASLRGRIVSGLIAALTAGLGYNFLFTEPRYTFWMNRPEDVLQVAVLILIGGGIGALSGRVRSEASMARIAERRYAALAELTGRFGGITGVSAISVAAGAELARQWRHALAIWIVDQHGSLVPVEAPWSDRIPETDATAHEAASWVLANSREAGNGTDTLRDRSQWMLPLGMDAARLGVLAISGAGDLESEARAVIRVQAGYIAQALERGRLAEQGQAAALEAAHERQRATLLGSISHDLRTPLGVIQGASESLLGRIDPARDPGSHELATLVHEESRQLTAQVLNILDMTRLRSGSITLDRSTVAVEELLEALLERVAREWPQARMETRLPDDRGAVCLVCDQLLIEQALLNLIANAVRHGGSDHPITCAVEVGDQEIAIGILDRGPGLPPDHQRLFAPFVRGEHGGAPDARRGVGLGLAIAQEIAILHGGSLQAANRPDGGAAFWMRLPVGEIQHG